MKKFLVILGGIFAVIIVAIGVAAFIFIPRAMKLDGEARAYIQSNVPLIAGTWNKEALVNRATPELLSTAKSPDQIDKMFATLQKQLGPLKHLATPKGSVGVRSETGSVVMGNYTAQSDFEKGTATFKIQLRRDNDSWKINGFFVTSDLLASPKT